MWIGIMINNLPALRPLSQKSHPRSEQRTKYAFYNSGDAYGLSTRTRGTGMAGSKRDQPKSSSEEEILSYERKEPIKPIVTKVSYSEMDNVEDDEFGPAVATYHSSVP